MSAQCPALPHQTSRDPLREQEWTVGAPSAPLSAYGCTSLPRVTPVTPVRVDNLWLLQVMQNCTFPYLSLDYVDDQHSGHNGQCKHMELSQDSCSLCIEASARQSRSAWRTAWREERPEMSRHQNLEVVSNKCSYVYQQ